MVVENSTILPGRKAPTREAEPRAGSAQQASECLTTFSFFSRSRIRCDSCLQVVEPSASHKGLNSSLQTLIILKDCPPRPLVSSTSETHVSPHAAGVGPITWKPSSSCALQTAYADNRHSPDIRPNCLAYD